MKIIRKVYEVPLTREELWIIQDALAPMAVEGSSSLLQYISAILAEDKPDD